VPGLLVPVQLQPRTHMQAHKEGDGVCVMCMFFKDL
jgi:hypothetical protein